jgi:hypothetical protein
MYDLHEGATGEVPQNSSNGVNPDKRNGSADTASQVGPECFILSDL